MTILAGIKCLVANCGGTVAARGLCSKHYKQQQRHGAPSEEVSAKLIDGKKFKDHALYQTWRSISRAALGTAICDEWKDFEQFVKDVGTKPEDARSLRRVDTTKPYSKTNAYWYTAVWSDDKKAQAKNHQRAFRAANPDYARWMSIKSKYGLTKERYKALLARESGVCAICEKPEKRTTQTGKSHTRDINDQGVCVMTEEPLPEDAEVHLIITIPGRGEPLSVVGRVTHTVVPEDYDVAGMGIVFRSSPTDAVMIAATIDALEQEFLAGTLPEETLA